MRILVLTESLKPTSGWGAYSMEMVQALRASGLDLVVLTAGEYSEGVKLPPISAHHWAWWWTSFRLRRWLTAHEFDAIHVMVEPYARLHRAFGKTPFIITVHGSYGHPTAHGSGRLEFTEALKRACRIIAVSDYTKRSLAPEIQLKTAVISNGVNPGIVHESFEAAPAHGQPLILSVGAIKARKGYDRLIAGFAEFVKSHARAELVIVGRITDAALYDKLQKQVTDLGLAGNVRFLGQVKRTELLGWYRACDVFALTPVAEGGFEGFGLVYLEANVFGKPCVGSHDSGAEEAIREGENGYLAIADDPGDVALALERGLSHDTESARKVAMSHSWDGKASVYLEIYRRLSGIS